MTLAQTTFSWRCLAILLAFILICQSAGAIGGIATARSVGAWYRDLARPSFSPPNWVFGPVWITLYLLMAVAAFLVYLHGWEHDRVKLALGLFVFQLLVNAVWSPVFFGLRWPVGGLIVIVVLLAAILAATILFWPISRPAAILMLPYLAWVAFATVLNAAIVRLNS